MQHLRDALVQLAVSLILVSVAWAAATLWARARGQPREPWRSWLGLTRPRRRRLWVFPASALFAMAVAALQFAWVPEFGALARNTPAYEITRQTGLDRLVGALAYPLIASALCEELLFRGLIAKRLIRWLGLPVGNALQTLVFLAPHILLVVFFAKGAGAPMYLSLLFAVTPVATLGAWVMERHDRGSLWAPWLIHSGVNFGTMLYFWAWVPTLPIPKGG